MLTGIFIPTGLCSSPNRSVIRLQPSVIQLQPVCDPAPTDPNQSVFQPRQVCDPARTGLCSGPNRSVIRARQPKPVCVLGLTGPPSPIRWQ
ncbi:unnamed protein product [Gadus morhua 'NCC']